MSNQARRYALSTTQLTSTGTGNVQTASAPEGAEHAVLTAVTNMGYLTFDGSTPSSSNGHPLPTGAVPFYLPVAARATLKWASSVASNSILNITWVTQ